MPPEPILFAGRRCRRGSATGGRAARFWGRAAVCAERGGRRLFGPRPYQRETQPVPPRFIDSRSFCALRTLWRRRRAAREKGDVRGSSPGASWWRNCSSASASSGASRRARRAAAISAPAVWCQSLASRRTDPPASPLVLLTLRSARISVGAAARSVALHTEFTRATIAW